MMMTHDQFHQYFAKEQQLSTCIQNDANALNSLFQLIETERNTTCENLPYEEFLKGEHAFFSGKYKHALQHYLRAKSIPYFTLFCYRASAYVSESSKDFVKALNFAKQALTIYPDDYMTLVLLEKLFSQEQQNEDAEQTRHKIQALKEKYPHPYANEVFSESEEDQSTLSVSCKERSFLKFQSSGVCLNGPMQVPKELHAYALKSPQTTETSTMTQERPSLSPKFNLKEVTSSSLHGSSAYLEPIFFTSLGTKEPQSTATLTQRLYSKEFSQNKTASDYMIQEQIPKAAPRMTSSIELKNLEETLQGTPFISSTESTHAHDKEQPETILEQSIKAFQRQQSERINHYLEQFQTRPLLSTHCLYFLHGWVNKPNQQFHLTEHSRKSDGGYYLRWNGKGIVINPGIHFLENFHRQGLHIKDIDYVIVTGDHPDSYADIQDMHTLNYQLNQAGSELQIIHYYLNPKAYQALSSTLKPHFKQERHAIHCLELFQDSPDIEQVELSDGIALSYFPLGKQTGTFQGAFSKDARNVATSANLGLRFDLKTPDNDSCESGTALRLGYISGAPWSHLLGHHLELCDVLITGFGHTHSDDYTRLKYNEDCLGFYGTFSLLEEISPQLLFCSEFDGKEGDVRLEVVKMLRQQYAAAYPNARNTPNILPVDVQLVLNLLTLQIQCSATQTLIDPSDAHIVKGKDRLLQYLSPRCCL
jgi:tetratricopeptide (TPR) repeat protein